ncbi:rubredoxin [Pseudomonas taeanensis]|jgi:rubredoxin|uniref:rubredoxin n=1 Tax=Pseudomonas taeanensis TaxID=574962 RepID=UPI0009F9BA3B
MARYQCPDCQYVYDESKGEEHEGFAPNTPWIVIPEDWCCPDCAVRDKLDFVLIEGSTGEKNISSNNTLSVSAKVSSSDVNTEISNTTMGAEIALDVATEGQHLNGHKPRVTNSQSGAAFLKWICITCGHIYDEALGDEVEGFAPGTRFEDIPNDWCCPDCGATKEDYVLYQEKLG